MKGMFFTAAATIVVYYAASLAGAGTYWALSAAALLAMGRIVWLVRARAAEAKSARERGLLVALTSFALTAVASSWIVAGISAHAGRERLVPHLGTVFRAHLYADASDRAWSVLKAYHATDPRSRPPLATFARERLVAATAAGQPEGLVASQDRLGRPWETWIEAPADTEFVLVLVDRELGGRDRDFANHGGGTGFIQARLRVHPAGGEFAIDN